MNKFSGNIGERPHECPECHRKFSSTSNLKTHRRLHTGDKPFPCDLCTCRFTQYVHLKLHIRLHRNERPFNCRCGKAYISSSGLRTHWKTTASCTPTQEDLENMNKTAEYLAVVEKEMQLNIDGGTDSYDTTQYINVGFGCMSMEQACMFSYQFCVINLSFPCHNTSHLGKWQFQ